MRSLESSLKRILVRCVEYLAPPPASAAVPRCKKILIVRQHDQLGDLLISTPAIRAVRKRFPDAFIAIVVREYTAPVIFHNPSVDQVIVFTEKLHSWTWRKWRRFWKSLRSGFDCAIVLNSVSRSLTSDIIAVLSGADTIVGPDLPSHDSAVPERVYNLVAHRDPALKPEVERSLDIVRVLGAGENDHEYELVLTDEERSKGDDIFRSLQITTQRSIVGFHFGAENPAKCLPLETLARVIDSCFEEYGFEIILMRGPGEEKRLELLMKMIRVPVHAAPVVPLRIAAALIARCSLFVCNDTGTLHIASALRIPTVSFHALTDPAIWKPGHRRHIGLYAANGEIGSIQHRDILCAIETQRLNAEGSPQRKIS